MLRAHNPYTNSRHLPKNYEDFPNPDWGIDHLARVRTLGGYDTRRFCRHRDDEKKKTVEIIPTVPTLGCT